MPFLLIQRLIEPKDEQQLYQGDLQVIGRALYESPVR